jgi:hypothetical protein
MTIQRRFEPDPEALERVEEILYQLLVDSPEVAPTAGESHVSSAQSPCLAAEQE